MKRAHMSYADPYQIIDHIPKDFEMKVRQRNRGPKPVKPEAPAPARKSTVLTVVAFLGALAIIAGALITGAWNDAH